MNWQTTLSARKPCFLLCSKDQPLSGMRITLQTLPPGRMFEKKIIIRFSDGPSKFRYRMEVEHCFRGDGVAIWNFLHRIERTADKGLAR